MPRSETEPGDADDAIEQQGPADSAAGYPLTPVPDGALATAAERARRALDHPNAARWLAAYYDTDGDYAGRTFVEALDSPAGMLRDQFTPADLFAVSLLQVDIAPRAARVFLDPGTQHKHLVEALKQIPDDEDLALAGPAVLGAMAVLYTRVKGALGRDPWVTASKVCARKRPRLFPVRDKRVRMLLGLYEHRDYTIDWQVFAHLMRQPGLTDRLAALAEEASSTSPTVRLDPYPLRHLDVLLWMDARQRGIGGARR